MSIGEPPEEPGSAPPIVYPPRAFDDLTPEVLATARHVELSRPEASSGWFPKAQLVICTLVVAACLFAMDLIRPDAHAGYLMGVPVLVVSFIAAGFGQAYLVPIAAFALYRYPSLRTVENTAVLLGSQALYLYVIFSVIAGT